MVGFLFGDDSNFNLGPLFLEGGERWPGIVRYIRQIQGCFRGLQSTATISQTVSLLSCDFVNFKEKRSLTSYIQQFTLQCFFSLHIQFKLIYDKYLSHKFM